MKIRLYKSRIFNCYVDAYDRYVVCGSFVKNRILGKTPNIIDIWIIPSKRGNIELKEVLCRTMFLTYKHLKYDMEGVKGNLPIACNYYWKLLNEPKRVSVYAKDATDFREKM